MNMSESSGSRMPSTDFSIERILSDEPRVQMSAPSWLCCTRYRPPRLPRKPSLGVPQGGCRARRSGRHARVPFTASQAAALEAAYSRAPYLAPPALRALAAALQLRDDRIKIWFQNRRARDRREKCTSVAPPQAVTLPPTCELTFNSSMTRGHFVQPGRESVHENVRLLDPLSQMQMLNQLAANNTFDRLAPRTVDADSMSRISSLNCFDSRSYESAEVTQHCSDDAAETDFERSDSPLNVDTIDGN